MRLKSERPSRFKIIGFIDKKSKNESKEILGLPIIHLRHKISVILRAYGAQALILADKNMILEERKQIVNECLEYDFKVFRAPIVSDMEDNANLTQQIQNVQIEDLLERDPIVLNNKLIAKELYNRRIMVTGGAGSIGKRNCKTSCQLQTRKTHHTRSGRNTFISNSNGNKI